MNQQIELLTSYDPQLRNLKVGDELLLRVAFVEITSHGDTEPQVLPGEQKALCTLLAVRPQTPGKAGR